MFLLSSFSCPVSVPPLLSRIVLCIPMFVFVFVYVSWSCPTSSSTIDEADSGVLNGPSNLHGVCVGSGSRYGERGEAMIEASNEKGREDGATADVVSVDFMSFAGAG
jgi:hypothetical protein